jgi:hypothetical protein
MPRFSALDTFETPHPRGLVGLCDPLPREPVSQCSIGGKVAKRDCAFPGFVNRVDHPFTDGMFRRVLKQEAHRAATPIGASDSDLGHEYPLTQVKFKHLTTMFSAGEYL